MKQTIIIRASTVKLHVEMKYLVIKDEEQSDRIIAYRYIQKLYINQHIALSIANALKLASHFELFFIDQYGHIVGEMVRHEKV